MTTRIAAFALALVLFSNVGFGEDAAHRDVCHQLVPNPPKVTQFYEDNPTYLDPNIDSSIPTGTPESQGMQSAPLLKGAAYLTSLAQPLSLLVIKNGVIVFEKYFHGSRIEAANNVHSSSKTILSALIGIAIRERYLSGVDQKISEILSPKFKIKSTKQGITIKHLLSMSAGFDWVEDETEYDIEAHSNWVQSILNLPLALTPGTGFNYDTGLTHMLSAIISESSGMDTCAFAEKYLFEPMGITVKHWGVDPQGYYSGGYNLYLTARDLAKIGQMYLQKGEWQGRSLVPSEYIEAATSNGVASDHPEYTYGYLWWLLNAKGHVAHKMWGYGGQYVYVVPDLDLVFVTTADTKDDHPEMDGDAFLAKYVIPAAVRKARHRH